MELKTEFNIDTKDIYSIINGNSEWNDLYEKEIIEIKVSLNHGNWECLNELKRLSDTNILIELLFDWLQDNVYYVISPDRVKALFETEKNLKKQLESDNINKFHNKEENRKISAILKSQFKMIEYETITCFAHFMSKLYPPCLNAEFNNALEKISACFLGYEVDHIDSNKEHKENVQNFIMVIKYYSGCLVNCDINEYDSDDSFKAAGNGEVNPIGNNNFPYPSPNITNNSIKKKNGVL